MTGDAHEVLTSTSHIASTCVCGWTSTAVANYVAKLNEAEAHMHTAYSVFVESLEPDGTTVMCWGTP